MAGLLPSRRGVLLLGALGGLGAAGLSRLPRSMKTPRQGSAPPPREGPRDWVNRVTRMGFGSPGEAAKLADAGCEVMHTNVVWPYFPLRRDGGGLSARDARALRELVQTCHRKKMKVALGLPPFMPVDLVKKHPDWRIHADDTGSIL